MDGLEMCRRAGRQLRENNTTGQRRVLNGEFKAFFTNRVTTPDD